MINYFGIGTLTAFSIAILLVGILQMTKCNTENNNYYDNYRHKDNKFIIEDVDPFKDSLNLYSIYYMKSLYGYTINNSFNDFGGKTSDKNDGKLVLVDVKNLYQIGDTLQFCINNKSN